MTTAYLQSNWRAEPQHYYYSKYAIDSLTMRAMAGVAEADITLYVVSAADVVKLPRVIMLPPLPLALSNCAVVVMVAEAEDLSSEGRLRDIDGSCESDMIV